MAGGMDLRAAVERVRLCCDETGQDPATVPRSHFLRWQRQRDFDTVLSTRRMGALGGWDAIKAACGGQVPAAPAPSVAPESAPVRVPGRAGHLERPEECPVPVAPVDISALDWDEDEDTVVDRAKTYVVTYAQNATPVHENFLASLLVFCEHRDADLIVCPGRYKNPTSVWAREQEAEERWDPRLEPYLLKQRPKLAPDLIAYCDISIQPTAVRPLTGFEVFAGEASAILAHPKIQLRTIPSKTHGKPRIQVTTGAITLPNYTDSKAGKKGHAHHVFGAALVEVCGSRWHLRQIYADDAGVFIDLDEEFSPAGVEPAPRPKALVTGDAHVACIDEQVVDATLRRPDSIARTLHPEEILYHDLLDFRARNHHSIDDPNERFARARGDIIDSVEEEVVESVRFVDRETPEDAVPVVVGSNHDEAFDRWLKESNPRTDPVNARFFHAMRAEVLRTYEETGEWVPAFELAYQKHGSGRAVFVRRDESHLIEGIECGFHGDLGTNGSRASILSYSKLGAKVVIGHSHSPGILDGAFQNGVMGKLDQGYNRGPSSWMHAHTLIYANGKRTLIFVSDGEWRAPRPKSVSAAA